MLRASSRASSARMRARREKSSWSRGGRTLFPPTRARMSAGPGTRTFSTATTCSPRTCSETEVLCASLEQFFLRRAIAHAHRAVSHYLWRAGDCDARPALSRLAELVRHARLDQPFHHEHARTRPAPEYFQDTSAAGRMDRGVLLDISWIGRAPDDWLPDAL